MNERLIEIAAGKPGVLGLVSVSFQVGHASVLNTGEEALEAGGGVVSRRGRVAADGLGRLDEWCAADDRRCLIAPRDRAGSVRHVRSLAAHFSSRSRWPVAASRDDTHPHLQELLTAAPQCRGGVARRKSNDERSANHAGRIGTTAAPAATFPRSTHTNPRNSGKPLHERAVHQ